MGLQLIRQLSSMEIQKSISSKLISSLQNLPLSNYFLFRQQMMGLLVPEQKTSEYITKLWNQLISQKICVANTVCDTQSNTPDQHSDKSNFEVEVAPNSEENTTIFKQAGQCEPKIQQKTHPYIDESSANSENQTTKQKNIKKIPKKGSNKRRSTKP